MMLIHLPTFVALTSLGASVYASCLHGTDLLPRRLVKYDEVKTVEVSKFGYTGLQGPLNWAGLSEDNAACRESNNQSPINLADPRIEQIAPGEMELSIPKVEAAELENLGSTVEVVMEEFNATLAFGGKTFSLKQFHFHTPSEHRIDEEHFPLEMHNGDIAVVAVLFQLSEGRRSDKLVKSALANIHDVATPGSVTETCELDFSQFEHHLSDQPMFHYTGSLTTPPCKEGLTFLVTTRPLLLDVKTYNSAKKVIKFNSRYTQNDLGQENLLKVGCSK
ncbi:hypothetical protein FGG08_001518 [Glutinoglossum americanum]|uniref:carbonic anhydrase n=1 Tax=Glutinoglossum americanum TaxID=1670608 RepID=A0A9P8L679_9PEZI|nr:hypothetical protein FGG08_001518 [Glutinoglossum americanum]